ncbi:helix-turn-helix domain-containing protein [Chryseobacterium cucumeris]|uniref:helix-turn-helix domain-containing protein n=1 Tax=Chryseobacterium cucumeris TaxID=1813611 RepID=UPI00320A1060
MKNPKQEQTNRLANSMGYLMAYDFTHDPERNPEIAKPKSDLEFALDVAFPKRHMNKVLNELKKNMLSSVDIPGSIAENKLERIKGNVMLAYAKEMKRPVRFAKQGECQYTMELEQEKLKNPRPEKVGVGLLNVKEAAKALGITTYNLQNVKRRGEIESTKIGGRFFFTPEEVERFRIQRAIDKL